MAIPADSLPEPPAGPAFDLLAGIRVVDLTTSIAGPYATMLLGDLGAEVIKIERPGAGDDARAWGPPFLDGQSLWYLSVNRNKRSVTLDIAKPEGLAVLHDLVRRADVVVTNQVPRVQEKLGTDEATLRRLKPDLVFVSLTGFGLAGERRDLPCYDLIAEGYSGIMDLTGELDSDPQKVGTPAADLLAGMDAAMMALASLVERRASGRGRAIDVALVDSMTRFVTPRLVSYLGSGELPRRSGARDSVIAIYQTFHAADAPLTLGLGNDAIWRRFWQAVGQPKRGEDARTATNAGRRAARAELVGEIAAILRTRPRAEWLDIFARAKVPAGPINRLDEVAADPALQARGLFYSLPGGPGGAVPQVGTGVLVDGHANAPRTPPPALGQDTEAVLGELLGYDGARLSALRAAEAI